MRHIWSLLCKKSSVDIDTNNLTIGEVLEEITFNIPLEKDFKFPASFNFDYEIISYWLSTNPKNGEKFYMEIVFVDPSKKTLNTFEQEIIFPENKKRLRTRIKTNALNLTREGEYTFIIKAKEKKGENFKILAEIPLAIIIKRTVSTKKS